MEFHKLDSRPGKSWNCGQVMEIDVGKLYVWSRPAYCSGLSEMYM